LIRQLDVTRHRIDSENCKAEAFRQLHGMVSLAAAEVEHVCPGREAKTRYHVIENFRAAGIQALVEGSLERPLDSRVLVVVLKQGRIH
jgi:hypothetical protein